MTGYQSKKAAAQAKLEDDDDIQTYTRPWVGLTEEEIAAFDWNHAVVDAECVRAIEARLKEKNT
jgi:hypothetical protein